MNNLDFIINEFIQNGIDATYQTERPDPYVNVGDVKHVRDRMQFWIPKNPDEIHMFVGKDMGKWNSESLKSPYVDEKYKHSDKECKVTFPGINQAVEFIRNTVKM